VAKMFVRARDTYNLVVLFNQGALEIHGFSAVQILTIKSRYWW